MIWKFFPSVLIDVCLLPVAFLLILFKLCGCTFDFINPPPKKGLASFSILFIHGSGFNENEWIVGRWFLRDFRLFTLSYDGLLKAKHQKGIEDFANGDIRSKCKEIQRLTNCDTIVLIGHSMGGLIAGYYAEFIAAQDCIQIPQVISIATPWQGAPIIDTLWSYFPRFRRSKRYVQMSVQNKEFRSTLLSRVRESEMKGIRKYYNVGSKMDLFIQDCRCTIEENRVLEMDFGGHYLIIVLPWVWRQIHSWLKYLPNVVAFPLPPLNPDGSIPPLLSLQSPQKVLPSPCLRWHHCSELEGKSIEEWIFEQEFQPDSPPEEEKK